jgi:signal transduction histidine kinase
MTSRFKLRSKFLLWMVVISAVITAITLLLVRKTVEHHLRGQIVHDLQNSISTFKNVQRQRESGLERTSALVANLPISRALMSTKHQPTIQDGSADLWKLAGTDLLVMADRGGTLLAIRSKAPIDATTLSDALRTTGTGAPSWWYVGGHLYEVAIQPIYFGTQSDDRIVGFLVLGSDLDERVAQELSEVAGIEVAFRYSDEIVRSTLADSETASLSRALGTNSTFGVAEPVEMQLGSNRFLVSSISLEGTGARPRFIVLKSLSDANAFVHKLDKLLLGLGMLALFGGSFVVFIVSRAFTRPLEHLLEGVRALGAGDYQYPLHAQGHDEVAELTSAFSRMRSNLQASQQELLSSERLATIGRMASSISHDLRHHLVAVLANAEFLVDDRNETERQELYEELKASVGQMNDLIESLLELSRPRESLRISRMQLDDVIERAVQVVRVYPQFCNITLEVNGGPVEGWFDGSKLQRVFQNLIVNACEAMPALWDGFVQIRLTTKKDFAEVRVTDNGRGMPDEVRESAFDAFVSHAKGNGTGLGLTIVRKIVQDHGGSAVVEATSRTGTTMLVRLPMALQSADQKGENTEPDQVRPVVEQ